MYVYYSQIRSSIKILQFINPIICQDERVQRFRLRHTIEVLELVLMQIQGNQTLELPESVVLNILYLVFGNAQICHKCKNTETKWNEGQMIFIKIQLQESCQSAKALVWQTLDLVPLKFKDLKTVPQITNADRNRL